MKIIGIIKEKLLILSTTKKVLYGAGIIFLLLIIIVPALRWIFWTLVTIAVTIVAIIGTLKLQKKVNENTSVGLKSFPNQFPQIYKYMSVEETPMATPLPEHLLSRTVWRSLPAELRESEPTLSIAPNFVLSCNSTALGGNASYALLLETGAVVFSIMNALDVMSRKLGIADGTSYKQIVNILEKTEVIAQQDKQRLFQAHTTYTNISLIKAQLLHICAALNVDYDSSGLGTWDPGRSSYSGRGSWGMIGIGLALSAGSAMNASAKKSAFENASLYVAFNNIVEYFNEQYFTDEYSAWKAKQLPGKVKLSINQPFSDHKSFEPEDSTKYDYKKIAVQGLADNNSNDNLSLYEFCDGVAVVCIDDNKYGVVGLDGSLVVPADYCFIDYWYSNGLASFKRRPNGKYGFMDTTGRIVISEDYDEVGQYGDGLIPVKGKNGKWSYIDANGKEIIPPSFDNAAPFCKGYAHVESKNKWGLIDKTGKLTVPYSYDQLFGMSDGLIGAKKGNKWGFIDADNNVVIPFDYGSINSFSEGIAAVTKQAGNSWEVHDWGYIDKSGTMVIPTGYYTANEFKNGLASVKFNKDDNETRFIDKSGKVMIEIPYHCSNLNKDGYTVVSKLDSDFNFMHGIINKNGHTIVPFIYNEMSTITDDGVVVAYCKKDRRFYVIDLSNNNANATASSASQKWNDNDHLIDSTADSSSQILTK